jgi:tetratricopeptide (TPR) repeat protein
LGHERQSRHAELRVFISSTFRDLHEEREHLVKKIFPEIRVLCRERGIEFTEIDLRWGLSEEEEKLGRIIRSCLEEIDRCRPYFIGIVGERYGWVPSLAEIHKDFALLEHYPWIEDAVAEGMSLLEMECEHGALRQPADATGAFFYVRRERRHPGEQAPQADPRLDQFRQRIYQSGLPVREFRDPSTLAEMVYDDLVAILERDFGIDEVLTELESERQYHEAFAANRRRAHIPNAAYIQRLDDHVRSDEGPLLIQAASGSGKSALVAYWTERFRKRHPGAFVVEHYTGIGHGSGDRYSVIRNLLMEIAEHRGLDEKIPEEPGALVAALPEWLAMLGDEQMVLVLDGVNQLPEEERDLHWFPAHIPANIRLIVTSTDDLTGESDRHGDWQVLRLTPLSLEEREALVVRYLSEFHKSLAPDQLRMIASSPQTAQPLYLRILLEELRMFGQFEVLDRQLEHYLGARDTGELFQRVLERMEEDFGARFVQDVLRLIWVSRDGLGKEEIAGITLLSRTRLNLLLNALDYHLIERGGRLTFFHTYFRDAAEHRYCSDPQVVRATRAQLVEYFEQQPADERKADELPWQLREMEEWGGLAVVLTDLDLFDVFIDNDRTYELIGYWLSMQQHVSMTDAYQKAVERLEQSGASQEDQAGVIERIGNFLQTAGEHAVAGPMLENALQIRESIFGSDDLKTSRSLISVGQYYFKNGEYDRAESILQRALIVLERELGEDDSDTIECLELLAEIAYARRDYIESEKLFRRVLTIHERKFGQAHTNTASSIDNLGAAVYARGDFAQAELLMRRAVELNELTRGRNHPATANSYNTLGAVLLKEKKTEAAIQLLKRAVEISELSLGPTHPTTASYMLNLAHILTTTGDYVAAREYCQRALDVSHKVWGSEHPTTAYALVVRAVLLRETGYLAEAEEDFRMAQSIRLSVLGPDHPHTIECWLYLASVLKLRGELEEADKLYRVYLPLKEKHTGLAHSNTRETMREYIELLKMMGRELEGRELEERLVDAMEDASHYTT